MTDSFLPLMRALVAGALLLATATLMLVAVKTVRASAEPRLAPCATAFQRLRGGARRVPSRRPLI